MSEASASLQVYQQQAEFGGTTLREHYPETWDLTTIAFEDTDVIGFLSDPAAATFLDAIPGLIINNAVIAPGGVPKPRITGGFEQGIRPLTSATFKYQDLGGALTDLIANRLANQKGLRGKIHRHYQWPKSEQLDIERDLVSTYQLTDRSWSDGYKSISAIDIARNFQTRIFEPRSWRLLEPISAAAESLTIAIDPDDEPLPFWQHDRHYSTDPELSMLYIRAPNGEIIGAMTQTPVGAYSIRLSDLKRGALNTQGTAIEFNLENTEVANRPELKEWTYFEETLPNFLFGLMTGFTLDYRKLPAHWQMNTDRRWVSIPSLLYAAPELATLRLRAEDYGSTEGKRLIEKEILPFIPAIMPINELGQVQLIRVSSVRGGSTFVFDGSNIDMTSVKALGTKSTDIKSLVGIRAGYDARTKTFDAPVTMVDADSLATHGVGEPLVIDSKLLHSSITTQETIRALLPLMAERYLAEQDSIEFTGQPSTAEVKIASRAQLVVPWTRVDNQSSGGQAPLSHSVRIESINPNTRSGGVQYVARRSDSRIDQYRQTIEASVLSLAAYEEDAVDLRAALGVGAFELRSGIWYLEAGDYDVSTRLKYNFLHGPLYCEASASLIAVDNGPMVQLWVPHALHFDGSRAIVTTGRGYTRGGVPGQLGDHGYCAPIYGPGDLFITGRYDQNSSSDYILRSQRLRSRSGRRYREFLSGDAPIIALTNTEGLVSGIPADLSGYGGPGGGRVKINGRLTSGAAFEQTWPGGSGKRGSAGVLTVSRGLTFGVSAKWILDGSDSDTVPQLVYVDSPVTQPSAYTSPGQGGGPGTALGLIDGNYPLPPLERHVSARVGAVPYLGGRASDALVERFVGTGVRTHYEGVGQIDLATTCSRAIQIPAAAIVQERLTGFAALFGAQSDFARDLIITADNVAPSGGNDGDLALWRDYADGNLDEPPMLERINGTWVRFEWTGDRRFLGRLAVDGYRSTGATRIYDQLPDNARPNSLFWNQASNEVSYIQTDGSLDLFIPRPHDAGETILADPYFNRHVLEGVDSWDASQERFALPLVSRLTRVNVSQSIAKPVFNLGFSGDYIPKGSGGGGGGGGTVYTVAVTQAAAGVIQGTAIGYVGRGGYISSDEIGGIGIGTENVQPDNTWQVTADLSGLASARYKIYFALADNSQAQTVYFDYTA